MSTYLVTGITSGIGQGCTEALLAQGHQVVSLCRNLSKAQEMYPTAIDTGQLVLLEHDFSANAELYRKCRNALAPNQIAGLIHCAGQTATKRLIKTDYTQTLQLFEVNFLSFSELCRALLHLRKPPQELSLLVISSMAALRPTLTTPMYACVKGLINHYIGLSLRAQGCTTCPKCRSFKYSHARPFGARQCHCARISRHAHECSDLGSNCCRAKHYDHATHRSCRRARFSYAP